MEREGRSEKFESVWNGYLDTLFLRTLEDLEARSARSQLDSYSALGIAGLLRKLLLDEQRLADAVNRERRVKWQITLRPVHWDDTPPLGFQGDPRDLLNIQGECLDPDIPCGETSPVTVPRASFLRYVVARDGHGNQMTVREYIKYVAHVEGAVHIERRLDNEFQRALFEFGLALNSGGGPGEWSQQYLLRALGRVVSKSLQPLAEAVREGA